MEKTFEELIIQLFPNHKLTKDRWSFELMQFSADDLIEFGIQVREATIAEAVNYCVSQDWIKTVDNLKRMPTDRIIDFEKPTDRIKLNEK